MRRRQRGSILVDQHTNSMIIQATRDDLRRMIPMIERLDKPTSRLVVCLPNGEHHRLHAEPTVGANAVHCVARSERASLFPVRLDRLDGVDGAALPQDAHEPSLWLEHHVVGIGQCDLLAVGRKLAERL